MDLDDEHFLLNTQPIKDDSVCVCFFVLASTGDVKWKDYSDKRGTIF